MDEGLFFEGKDISEALAKACNELNVDKDELSYEVEESEKNGIFPWSEKKVKIKVLPNGNNLTLKVVRSLVDKICRDAKYNIETKTNRRYVDIECSDKGLLIGNQGKTLEALQYLTNIIFSKNCNDGSKIIIDVGGYRSSKQEKLLKQVESFAQRVQRTKKAVRIPQVNSYDRRTIHLLISEKEDLTSYSEGEGNLKDIYIANNCPKEE